MTLQINQNKLTDEVKKSLDGSETRKKITRIGVYGVVTDEGKILAVRQQRGPYAGKLDFPGGGIEFGESAEQAMRREFAEEVAMEFDSLQLVDNLTVIVDVPSTPSNEPYLFYQIGMIYRVNGCRLIKDEKLGDLQHVWVDLMALSEEECSKLLWMWRMNSPYQSVQAVRQWQIYAFLREDLASHGYVVISIQQ